MKVWMHNGEKYEVVGDGSVGHWSWLKEERKWWHGYFGTRPKYMLKSYTELHAEWRQVW